LGINLFKKPMADSPLVLLVLDLPIMDIVNCSSMSILPLLRTSVNPNLVRFYTPGPLVERLADFFNLRRTEDLRAVFNRDNERRKALKYLRNVSINITYTNGIGRMDEGVGDREVGV
jgi:hypothetical protein